MPSFLGLSDGPSQPVDLIFAMARLFLAKRLDNILKGTEHRICAPADGQPLSRLAARFPASWMPVGVGKSTSAMCCFTMASVSFSLDALFTRSISLAHCARCCTGSFASIMAKLERELFIVAACVRVDGMRVRCQSAVLALRFVWLVIVHGLTLGQTSRTSLRVSLKLS